MSMCTSGVLKGGTDSFLTEQEIKEISDEISKNVAQSIHNEFERLRNEQNNK